MLRHDSAGGKILAAQRVEDRHQAIVALDLQLADRNPLGLIVGLLGDLLDQRVRKFRAAQCEGEYTSISLTGCKHFDRNFKSSMSLDELCAT